MRDPIAIGRLCDLRTALFHTLVVYAQFNLAFLDAALDGTDRASLFPSFLRCGHIYVQKFSRWP